MTKFGEELTEWVDMANRSQEESSTNWLTAFIEGFVEGHKTCCVIWFWALTITAIFMRIFKHKQLGWVDIVK